MVDYYYQYFLDPWRQLTGNQHLCLYIAKTTPICYFPWVDSSAEFYRKFVQHMKSSPIVMVFGIFKTRWVIILTVSLISRSKDFNFWRFWIIRGIGSLFFSRYFFRGISSHRFPRSWFNQFVASLLVNRAYSKLVLDSRFKQGILTLRLRSDLESS